MKGVTILQPVVWLFAVFFLGSFAKPPLAERGIVVAVNDRFAGDSFLASLSHLRTNLRCTLPIEIWHSGDELSEKMIRELKKFSGVSFHDIAKAKGVDPRVYRGWHMKPLIVALSRFDEVILMDADVFFFEDPAILFDEPGYLKTGAFFFLDLSHRFPLANSPVYTQENYLDRRKFIAALVPSPSACVPQDVKEFWSDAVPTLQKPFVGDLQESGCVAINKKLHRKSLEQIIALNENRAETYQHVHGDKETYWLGCELAKARYHMNEQRAFSLQSGSKRIDIVQFLGDRLFYQQKRPMYMPEDSVFTDHEGSQRAFTKKEIAQMTQARNLCHRLRAFKLP